MTTMSHDTRESRFYRLVTEHHVALRAFVAMLGVSADWVDDVTQEAFLRAYVDFDRFDADRDFGAWLRGIVRNVVRNELRSNARRKRILHERVADIMLAASDQSPGPEAAEDQREAVAALRGCLDELPDRSRRLIQLRYVQDARATDIAQSLDASAASVRQALVRIRASLRECVDRRLGREGA